MNQKDLPSPGKDTKVQSEEPDKYVFVKGFGETLDDKELEMYFEDHIGNVEKAEVAKFEDGVSKGYGKVQFYSHQDAVKAVMKLNGEKVHGNILIVESFKPKQQGNDEPSRNVYVKGFGNVLDDDDLMTLFTIFGEIESAKVERDVNGKFKGFGYVCFKRYEDAETAVARMNGRKLGSKTLTVCVHQSKEERKKELKNRNLHVRNLHSSVSQDELKELFGRYGKILNVRVSASRFNGINQGHVCFETSKDADKAIAELNMYQYRGLKLKVSPLQPKYEKIRANEAGNSDHKLHHFYDGFSQKKSSKNDNDDKSRSKSMGNLTNNNAKLHVLGKLKECDKPLERARTRAGSEEEVSLTKTRAKVFTNSDQSHNTSKLIGNGASFSNKVHGKIAANIYQRDDHVSLESSGNEIYLPKRDVSQTAVKFNENHDENRKSVDNVADAKGSLHMPMAIPDLLKETRGNLLQSTLNSQESNAARPNGFLSSHMQIPSTVIQKMNMNSRGQRGKKAYICGANVKKS